MSRSNGGGGERLYIRNKAEALGCKAQRLCIHIARRQYKKYSDDGEPQGTAGVPVLDVLEKATSKMSALSQQGTSAAYFWEAEDSSERIRIPQK